MHFAIAVVEPTPVNWRYRPVPDGRPHISICREAALDEATGAWRPHAAVGYSANVPQPHELIPAVNGRRPRGSPRDGCDCRAQR